MNGYRYSLEAADAIRDEMKYAIPCRTCGAREPVSLFTVDGVSRCSECCPNHPRYWCAVCRRRLTAEEDAAAITIIVGNGTGAMCSYCQDRHGTSEDREP